MTTACPYKSGIASTESPSNSNPSCSTVTSDSQPQKVKPCCACPETKKARDNCLLFASSADQAENECREFIEKHRACMASYGFKI